MEERCFWWRGGWWLTDGMLPYERVIYLGGKCTQMLGCQGVARALSFLVSCHDTAMTFSFGTLLAPIPTTVVTTQY